MKKKKKKERKKTKDISENRNGKHKLRYCKYCNRHIPRLDRHLKIHKEEPEVKAYLEAPKPLQKLKFLLLTDSWAENGSNVSDGKVECPNPGCRSLMKENHLKRHLKENCKFSPIDHPYQNLLRQKSEDDALMR